MSEPKYTPVGTQLAPEETPTINGLLLVAQQHRVDRLCLVEKATERTPPQLVVLLLSSAALREIGDPFRKDILPKHPNDKATKSRVFMDYVSPVKLLTSWMNMHNQTWQWMQLPGDHRVALVFRGLPVCTAVAKILNRNNCPCNLT